MKLDQVVPWGRSLAEYNAMFALSPADRHTLILGCGDGPASFNAEMTALGHTVTSIDPLYAFKAEQIASRVAATYSTIIEQMKQNADKYAWDFFKDADAVGQARLAAMDKFLADFDAGLAAGRYRAEALPQFTFGDQTFDLALCSHLLFLYSEQLALDFHLASLFELCRVAREVRIFPILDLSCKVSPHLEPACAQLTEAGYTIELIQVAYEIQKGGTQMLRIQARE